MSSTEFHIGMYIFLKDGEYFLYCKNKNNNTEICLEGKQGMSLDFVLDESFATLKYYIKEECKKSLKEEEDGKSTDGSRGGN